MQTLEYRWDLTAFFPGVDSPEYRLACEAAGSKLDVIEKLFRQEGIMADGADVSADLADKVFGLVNEAGDAVSLIKAYVGCLVAADSNDEAAQAADSASDDLEIRLRKVRTQFTAWAGARSSIPGQQAAEHEYFIRRARVRAAHMLGAAEEALAADLSISGPMAWGKLHGIMGSQLKVEVDLPTGKETLPMSAVRNLAYDGDPVVRENAYFAELATWKSVEVPLSACLNGVKGAVNLLARKRRWDEALDESLFVSAIDRETLEAMLGAAKEFFPDFRRYLNAKARLLGKRKLPFYDIFAPVGEEAKIWTVDQAEAFVEETFRTFSDKLGDFAARAFREHWIDYMPRAGKQDGAFCCPFRGDESRIMHNFKTSIKSVSTLAHELGHGYHNTCTGPRTFLQSETPMTLAETASIFCETILKNAALEEGTDTENLTVLEASLCGSCQVVVDITSRFLFESEVFAKRGARELSPGELCQAMLDSQRATYGDGLDGDLLHPYMWAAKPHYYGLMSFYNYPYMFGLLFGLGLYAVYQQEPKGFQARYDDLLSSTGLDDAAGLARRFGIDTRRPDFWRDSLLVIRADIDRFVKIAGS